MPITFKHNQENPRIMDFELHQGMYTESFLSWTEGEDNNWKSHIFILVGYIGATYFADWSVKKFLLKMKDYQMKFLKIQHIRYYSDT